MVVSQYITYRHTRGQDRIHLYTLRTFRLVVSSIPRPRSRPQLLKPHSSGYQHRPKALARPTVVVLIMGDRCRGLVIRLRPGSSSRVLRDAVMRGAWYFEDKAGMQRRVARRRWIRRGRGGCMGNEMVPRGQRGRQLPRAGEAGRAPGAYLGRLSPTITSSPDAPWLLFSTRRVGEETNEVCSWGHRVGFGQNGMFSSLRP